VTGELYAYCIMLYFQLFFQVHGSASEPFWVWVEDPDTDQMYHSEYVQITKKQVGLNNSCVAATHSNLIGLSIRVLTSQL